MNTSLAGTFPVLLQQNTQQAGVDTISYLVFRVQRSYLLELALYLAGDNHHAVAVGRDNHLCTFAVHHLCHLRLVVQRSIAERGRPSYSPMCFVNLKGIQPTNQE